MNPNHHAPRARAAHASRDAAAHPTGVCAAHADGIFSARSSGLCAAHAAALFAFVLLAAGGALAQPAKTPDAQQTSDAQQKTDKADELLTSAPPPMRYLPEEVHRRLEGEADLKARTHLALDLAEERLARAAQQADADRFEEATAELGVYEALVADAVASVQSSGRSKNKQRDILKRVEMTLRSHVPRLETIRRSLPAAHAVYFKSAIEFVNQQRDLALNTFYDNTVIREPPPGKEKEKAAAVGERANGNAPAAPDNEKKPERQ
ncbi:MAG TPA: hypothetical protein VE713_09675 [Pyrinomonadaceae bacterium]|jgi:hypothetical protein|nr:hypothetical protein [Pyrinomonadaceae bacterium]